MKTIADIFNNPDAIFNDPYYEIHNTVEPCKYPPEFEEYGEFLDNIDHVAYPHPKNCMVHNSINPSHKRMVSSK